MTDDKRKKKKKRGRSKFLKFCFRSEDGPPPSSSSSSSDKSDGRNDNNGRLGKPELIAVSGRQGRDFIPDGNLVNGCDNGDDCVAKRSSSRRRISRILKAVLFNAKLKKNRSSSSKSSISSETCSSSLSTEKVCKTLNDGNAYVRECPDMDDSCSRRSNLFSSSSRTTSSAYSTSSRTTSSAYSTSTLSSINSNSRSLFDLKTSSRIDPLDFGHPVSSNSSNLKKSNPNNSNSSLCFDQKVSSSYRTDSPILRSQGSSKSLCSSKSTPTNSIPQSLSHQNGLSRLDSHDSRNSVSSNMLILMNPNPDKIMFGGNNWNFQWCLFLLLSLVVLVIWGRIFSIMCTSIWFYFVPCRQMKRVDSVTNMAECVDTESKHYKKRVIMAGLLERTRNPIR